jgi:1,4-alpha-glucan branching enzyme
LPWHLLEHPSHLGVQLLVRDLNNLYCSLPALHQLDCDHAGFEWLVTDDANQSVFAWLRKGSEPNARCVVAINFTPEMRRDYRIRVPFAGRWREVLNTDAACYGGGNIGNEGSVSAVVTPESPELHLVLPPLAAVYLVPEV